MHTPNAVDDLADQPRVVPGRAGDVDRAPARRSARTTASMPSPRLKTCSISSAPMYTGALDLAEDAGLIPAFPPR